MFWTGIEKKGINAMLKAILPQTSLLQPFIETTMGDFERFSHQITQAIISGYSTNRAPWHFLLIQGNVDHSFELCVQIACSKFFALVSLKECISLSVGGEIWHHDSRGLIAYSPSPHSFENTEIQSNNSPRLFFQVKETRLLVSRIINTSRTKGWDEQTDE